MDLDVPDALPTMVCRPPTLNGSPRSLRNEAAILAMPGVTDVALIATGIAVRARDLRPVHRRHPRAGRRLEPRHRRGRVRRDRSCKKLRKAEVPLAVPKVPVLAKTVEGDFSFMFRSSAALEPYSAIADVRADQRDGLGRPEGRRSWRRRTSPRRSACRSDKVKVNVITGGGSFGHKLFADHAIEAARDLQGDGQAGAADVAPRRRAAAGPGPPDVHLADPGDLPRRPGAQLRAAAHQRLDRLQPRASAR